MGDGGYQLGVCVPLKALFLVNNIDFIHCIVLCFKQSGTNAAKVKKRKQKIMNEDNATSHGEDDIPKKKKRKDKSDINTPIETIPESSSPQKKRKSGKIQKKKKFDEQSDVPQISHSPGFNPPAGIVHESLMNHGKKNKKR